MGTVRNTVKTTSDSEQDKGIQGEKEGRRERAKKAGTQSSAYRHIEKKNTREQAREMVER